MTPWDGAPSLRTERQMSAEIPPASPVFPHGTEMNLKLSSSPCSSPTLRDTLSFRPRDSDAGRVQQAVPCPE